MNSIEANPAFHQADHSPVCLRLLRDGNLAGAGWLLYCFSIRAEQNLISSQRLSMYTTAPSLLERIRKPDADEAWNRFVSLYTPFIFGLARRAGADREAAADVVQDVFLLLTQKMADFQYDPERSFRAWLWTVVMNRLREIARRRKLPVISGVHPADCEEPTDVAEFEEAEYRKYLEARSLEIMQRDFAPTTWNAFWQHVVGGRKALEVGAELGISEGAVYVATSRVLRRLRDELKELL